VSSVSDPNAICTLWSTPTAFNGFQQTPRNNRNLKYYDIDCFVNAGCDNSTALCPGYVVGDAGKAPQNTGYYDDYYYAYYKK
jgi:hypothetical protein